MQRSLLILTMVLGALLCGSAHAALRVEVAYRPAMDLFSLMDNVSRWSEGFTKPAYRDDWTERFGWTQRDEALALAYAAYRRRTYSDPGQLERDPATATDGLFAKRSSMSDAADPLAAHFLAAASIDEALDSFNKMADLADAEMLLRFYRHFEDRWRQVLAESAAFAVRVDELQAVLSTPETDAFLTRLADFYQVDIDRSFVALYVWWPPIDRTSADISGRAFFIRSNPKRHSGERGWEDIIMHEVTHYVSAYQDDAQKRALTDRFLERCDMQTATGFYDLLEEPLAVAWGNAAYAAFANDRPLRPDDSWYWRPLPALMGRLLWPHVEALYRTDETINDGIIDHAGEYCARLSMIVDQVNSASDTD